VASQVFCHSIIDEYREVIQRNGSEKRKTSGIKYISLFLLILLTRIKPMSKIWADEKKFNASNLTQRERIQ
jgi:hypothetical protein